MKAVAVKLGVRVATAIATLTAQADLASWRSDLNVPAVADDTTKPMTTLARLDMEGHESIYGQSGRLPRPVDYPGTGNGI